MEKQITHIKQRFNALDKPIRVIICFLVIIILGGLLFSMGKHIGATLYKAFAN